MAENSRVIQSMSEIWTGRTLTMQAFADNGSIVGSTYGHNMSNEHKGLTNAIQLLSVSHHA